jgi:hypothetical protein
MAFAGERFAMRATKAYIASLGTTGLLLAFSASLLLLVGTLFAFNAWPGAEIRDAVESVLVDDGDDSVRVAGPEQVALDASPAALAVASAPAGSTAPGAAGGTGFGDAGGIGGGTGPGTPGGDFVGGGDGGGGPTGGVTPPTTAGPALPSSPTVDTGSGTNQLADSTEQVTNNLGNTVGQVNPQLGNTVTETGQALSDIVRDLPDVKVGGGGGVKIGD